MKDYKNYMEDYKNNIGDCSNYMEDYRNYMDSVSVDIMLHNKIMNCMAQRQVRRSFGRRIALYRFAAVLACAAIILIAICAGPRLLMHLSDTANSRTAVTPTAITPTAVAPKDIADAKGTPDVKKQYALFFNRAEGASSQAKKYIPGYFTQELSQEDIRMLFGDAWQTMEKNYEINASAGFSGEGELEGIFVECKAKTTGFTTRIQMANGPVEMDYLYPNDIKLSDVNGTAVTAGYWDAESSGGQTLYYASFVLGQTGYYMEISGDESAKKELTALAGLIIENGASGADLSKIKPGSIPEWRENELTLEEAQVDPDFGDYVPDSMPAGFTFELARRTLNQNQDMLTIWWSGGMKYIDWKIMRLREKDKERIVDINAPETYDLTLYPVPYADSVPEELREIVTNPIFGAADLTINTVRTRAYTVNDAGDDNTGYRMHFSVLYGDILVTLNAKGVNPEEIFDILKQLRDNI